jgi:WD40 repeat protein
MKSTGWIKNIERYDENTILTSSFDGTVRVWTLDGSALPIQTSDKSNIVFSDSNTTRMK